MSGIVRNVARIVATAVSVLVARMADSATAGNGSAMVGHDGLTLGEWALKRARLANGGRSWATCKRIGFGLDSLTEGTPNSYAKTLGTMLGAVTESFGVFVSLRASNVSALVGLTDVRAVGDRSTYPRAHSWDGDGLFGNAVVNGGFRSLPNASAGVPYGWKKAKLFYLQQPGGGTFKVRQYSSDGSSSAATAVDCNGVLQLASIEIAVSPTTTQGYVDVHEVNGKVAFYAIVFGRTADDYLVVAQAQGGTSAQEWNRLDKAAQRAWLAALDLDLYLMCVGTNDRTSRTAAQFLSDLTDITGNMVAAVNAPGILIVEPTQTFDYAASNAASYAAVYRAVANAGKFGFWSMQGLLGSFAALSASYGMEVDGLHPTTSSHFTAGYALGADLGLTRANSPLAVFSAGGSAVVIDQYKPDISAWRTDGKNLSSGVAAQIAEFALGGAYVNAYVDLDVAVRVRPGVEYYVERSMRLYLRSGATSAAMVLSNATNVVKSSYVGGGWAGLALTLTTDATGGTLKVSASANFDTQVYAIVRDVRVLLGGGVGIPSVLLVGMI